MYKPCSGLQRPVLAMLCWVRFTKSELMGDRELLTHQAGNNGNYPGI